MANPSAEIHNLDAYKAKFASLAPDNPGPPLSGGGGGDTFDPMELRIAALEKSFEKIDGKLDKLIESVADFRRVTEVKLASVESELKSKASAAEASEIKGRVSNLPTTMQLLAFVIAVLAAAGLLKYFAP